jgi:hypothetical protein
MHRRDHPAAVEPRSDPVRRKTLFVGSERAGRVATIPYSLVESCKASAVNSQMYLTYILNKARDRVMRLPTAPSQRRVRSLTIWSRITRQARHGLPDGGIYWK